PDSTVNEERKLANGSQNESTGKTKCRRLPVRTGKRTPLFSVRNASWIACSASRIPTSPRALAPPPASRFKTGIPRDEISRRTDSTGGGDAVTNRSASSTASRIESGGRESK